LAVDVASRYIRDVRSIELINYEYNATFKVEDSDGVKFALRMNINSLRSKENLQAEIAFISHLASSSVVKTPAPVKTLKGEPSTSIRLDEADRDLHCVLYTWIDGEELGDEPTEEQLFALGAAMARMHLACKDFTLPHGAEAPRLDDFFWGSPNLLFSPASELEEQTQLKLKAGVDSILLIVAELYKSATPILIHADLHGWNLMWNEGALTVFDFDDCGLGLPIQDLATALYYLDTTEQDEALKSGYRSVAPLPEASERTLKALALHRRILLLNYIFETSNQEHREMRPAYLEETLKRVHAFIQVEPRGKQNQE
jgi:Ser/Thr protein kinase RdoA (MazF antagonist)